MPVIVCKRVFFVYIDDDNTTDPSQNPALLSYCCYGRQAMPVSCYTSCSHAVKNTSRCKEKSDTTLTDKTEQVNSGIKMYFIFIFLEIQIINTILWLKQITVAPQFKRRVNQLSFHIYIKGTYYAKFTFTCYLNSLWTCTQPPYNDKNPPAPFF